MLFLNVSFFANVLSLFLAASLAATHAARPHFSASQCKWKFVTIGLVPIWLCLLFSSIGQRPDPLIEIQTKKWVSHKPKAAHTHRTAARRLPFVIVTEQSAIIPNIPMCAAMVAQKAAVWWESIDTPGHEQLPIPADCEKQCCPSHATLSKSTIFRLGTRCGFKVHVDG